MEKVESVILIAVVLSIFVFSIVLYAFISQSSNSLSTPSFVKKIVFKEAQSIDLVSCNQEKGLIYACDAENGVIYISDLKGNLVGRIRKREYGKEGFLSVKDITSYENGILVSDPSQRQVFFCLQGKTPVEFIETTMSVLFRPGVLTTGDYMSVYVVDDARPYVYRFGPDGRLIESKVYDTSLKGGISSIQSNGKKLYLISNKTAEVLVFDAKKYSKFKLKGRKGDYYPFSAGFFDDLLVAADPFYQEVILFNMKGKEVASFGYSVSAERKMDLPVDLEVCGDTILVAEKKERSVSFWKATP
ncbi:MAG: hypothetical protein N2440_03390 [Actinobacteria bacterium]|nr:hypothetical protein [Actinomycetota bacterium]